MQRLSHSQAGLLPLERLQQAVTPEVCAELSARVRATFRLVPTRYALRCT
jgi:hypothetical protein